MRGACDDSSTRARRRLEPEWPGDGRGARWPCEASFAHSVAGPRPLRAFGACRDRAFADPVASELRRRCLDRFWTRN